MTGTIQDVTSQSELSREMARVNEELQQVNQLNADVLGVVGHDVRQPLALVLGQLEVLGTFWDDSDEASKLDRVDKALAAAKRLSALIDDILAMANFDTGSIATRPIGVRLEDVVDRRPRRRPRGRGRGGARRGRPGGRRRPVPPAPDGRQPGQQRPAVRRRSRSS